MGRRKLGLTSLLFRLGDTTTTTTTTSAATNKASSSSWPWPSCNQQPRTDSFRVVNDAVYKTANSIYDSTDSFFTQSTSEDNNSESFSVSDIDDSENLIRGLMRSDRLLFEPGGDTSSILEEAAKGCVSSSSEEGEEEEEEEGLIPFKESVVMAMESDDPYVDFKKSMEEMVAAHGIKDWECLEELLVWYLRVNGKKTHGYIVGAFVDLLVGLAMVNHHESGQHNLPCSSSSFSSSSSSSVSFLSLSSRNCYEIEEVEEESHGSC